MVQRKYQSAARRKVIKKRGRGFLNTLINKLPVELHLPTFRFCGPGTRLAKRLQRGDKGINPLDEACKVHDIAYSNFEDVENRNKADRELAEAASRRIKAVDSSLGEKLAALGITGAMKVKSKLGMGLKSKKRGGALKAKKHRRVKNKQRVIPIPKEGGFLPFLLPILGALGALGGGAAGIAKAVNDAKANRRQLEEQQRHDKVMEEAVKGKGLYLAPYKRGYGLYPWPNRKN